MSEAKRLTEFQHSRLSRIVRRVALFAPSLDRGGGGGSRMVRRHAHLSPADLSEEVAR